MVHSSSFQHAHLLAPLIHSPHSLLNHVSILSPVLTAIVHSSLSTGIVPLSLKTASVTPIIKKHGSDPKDFNNYHPISNLPFTAKIIERTVTTQLQDHLQNNNLFEPFQSGLHSKHSTETALVKITNDLLRAADSGLLSILILLDLSVAFDTISHPVLLERLAGTGVTGTALKWFNSYLTDRKQFVQMKNILGEVSFPKQSIS